MTCVCHPAHAPSVCRYAERGGVSSRRTFISPRGVPQWFNGFRTTRRGNTFQNTGAAKSRVVQKPLIHPGQRGGVNRSYALRPHALRPHALTEGADLYARSIPWLSGLSQSFARRSFAGRSVSRRHYRRRGAIQVGIERLEQRTLLSASHVVTNTSDSGAGSLRQAVLDANGTAGADTITFTATLSGQTITLGGTELPAISDDLTITGLGADQLAVSGDSRSGVFVVASGVVVVSGLNITGGTGHFSSFFGINGGGIFIDGGTLTINQCAIIGNNAHFGGGIFNGGGTLTITNSAISGNDASTGGGINNTSGTVTITNTTISGNSSRRDGGGIVNALGIVNGVTTMTITNSTISANSSDDGSGGGIVNARGTMTITNSTISGNSSRIVAFAGVGARGGGGIANGSGGTLTITNSTVSGNSTFGRGPGGQAKGGGVLGDVQK